MEVLRGSNAQIVEAHSRACSEILRECDLGDDGQLGLCARSLSSFVASLPEDVLHDRVAESNTVPFFLKSASQFPKNLNFPE